MSYTTVGNSNKGGIFAGTDDDPMFGSYTMLGDDAKKAALVTARNALRQVPGSGATVTLPGAGISSGPPVGLMVAGGAAVLAVIVAVAMAKRGKKAA